MSEQETQENEVPKKEHPPGTVKVDFIQFDLIKTVKMPTSSTGKGIKLVYENNFGPQTKMLPTSKFQGNAIKVPTNKSLKDAIDRIVDSEYEEKDFTMTQVKNKAGYWDIIDIVEGKVGVPGIQGANSGNGGGGYDPSGAIIGKIENTALALAIAKKGTKVVLEDALEILNSFDPDCIREINSRAKDLYKQAYLTSSQSSESTDSGDQAEPADDEDIDDDTPF